MYTKQQWKDSVNKTKANAFRIGVLNALSKHKGKNAQRLYKKLAPENSITIGDVTISIKNT